MYVIKTPNHLYNGVTEGVPFSQGIGKTDNKNIRNILVNDYGYEDITEEKVSEEAENAETGKDVNEKALEEMTVPELKELAKSLGLSGYSNLKQAELVDLIRNEENPA